MPQPSFPVRTAADIGAALRTLRKDQRLTQVDAAGLSDVGIRFLSELENGKPTVRLETLLKVLAAYGLELRLSGPGLEEPEPPRRPAGPTGASGSIATHPGAGGPGGHGAPGPSATGPFIPTPFPPGGRR